MRKNLFIVLSILTCCLVALHSKSQLCANNGGDQNGGQGSGGGKGGSGGGAGSPGIPIPIPLAHSFDPNDIAGPVGYDTLIRWVSINDKIGYRIRFENNPSFATAPAQNVFVYMPVPDYYNINSMKLGAFGFGRYTFQVPENSSFYSARLDVRDSLGLYVDFTAGIDVVKNQLFWIFRSIDPATGLAPSDAQAGFLPVNDTAINRFNDTLPKAGEGYVTFLINSKNTLVTGDTISGKATIVFDTNEEIPTNYWKNTIDAKSPTSNITTTIIQKDTIQVYWNGADDAGGSGIRDYSLYVSENGGPFLLYRNKIKESNANFVGTPGNTYCFFTLGIDNTGNVEPLKTSGFTCVALREGGPLPVNWLYFRGKAVNKDVVLNWSTASEQNTSHYEIERSINGVSFTQTGRTTAKGQSTSINNYEYIDKNAATLRKNVLYYRLKQLDLDQKFSYSSVALVRMEDTLVVNGIKVFPNPFDQVLTVVINSSQPATITDKLELFSIDGKLLYSKNISSRQNNSPIYLNDITGTLTRGTYLIKITLANKSETIKLIKH